STTLPHPLSLHDALPISSESVALTAFGFELVRDVLPGEAIFIDESGKFNSRQCAAKPVLAPCIFEYVYLARPDSVMEGVSVYERSEEHTSELQSRSDLVC